MDLSTISAGHVGGMVGHVTLQNHVKGCREISLTKQSTRKVKSAMTTSVSCKLRTSARVIFLLGYCTCGEASQRTYCDVGRVLHAGALDEEAASELVVALLEETLRTKGPGRMIITAMGVCPFC